MKNNIKLKTVLPNIIVSTVGDLLMGIGAESVSENIAVDEGVELHAYFPFDTDKKKIIKILRSFISNTFDSIQGDLKIECNWEPVKKESWEKWKSYLKTVRASKRVIIRPPWDYYKALEDEHVIEINPSLAFGTGHHETTTICIQFIDEIIAKNKIDSVLDVGCGSGVLAISALKLGAKSAVCIDNDFKATRETVSNSTRNNVEIQISSVCGLIGAINGKFDLIVSNIYAETLISLRKNFIERLNENGFLVLSGIMKEKKDTVIGEFLASGLSLVNEKVDGNWAGLLFTINKT